MFGSIPSHSPWRYAASRHASEEDGDGKDPRESEVHGEYTAEALGDRECVCVCVCVLRAFPQIHYLHNSFKFPTAVFVDAFFCFVLFSGQ